MTGFPILLENPRACPGGSSIFLAFFSRPCYDVFMTTYIDSDGTTHYQRTVVFGTVDEAAEARKVIRENLDVIVDQTGVVPAIVVESTDETKVLLAVATARRGRE